jgi:hypothetical protein
MSKPNWKSPNFNHVLIAALIILMLLILSVVTFGPSGGTSKQLPDFRNIPQRSLR